MDFMAGFPSLHIFSVSLLLLESTLCSDVYKYEALNIMKRMAEEGESFTDHDVAQVHLLKDQGQTRERLAKRDVSAVRNVDGRGDPTRLQLDLSSGFTLNMSVALTDILSEDAVVSFKAANGHAKRKLAHNDCYSFGHIDDSSGRGWAAISHCDGIFGFASSPKYEYFLHPVVGNSRHKRDAQDDYDLYVMWRYSQPNEEEPDVPLESLDDTLMLDDTISETYEMGIPVHHLNATGFVIEIAMFADEHYWKTLHSMYPGRENDFLLTRLAGTQALYSNREKVGYDVQIKVKVLEYWTTDPENYTFTEEFSNNLKSFCHYTASKYFYDVNVLNTGIVKWNDGLVGLAYVGGACTRQRCFALKGHDFKTFVGFSHELGHTLGLTHHNTANCPEEIKSQGGFMGGGSHFNFSPCMKYQLAQFVNKTKSNCLFTETGTTNTPKAFNNVSNVLPGQRSSPNGLCYILAGPGYKYVPNEKLEGGNVCHWFVCLNENKRSPEFRRARRFFAPVGFPCRNESFCKDQNSCAFWNRTEMTMEIEALREMTQIPQWSKWTRRFSPCSRTCGTGVRTRHRECLYSGFNMSPYCPGPAVIAALCQTQPCPGDPENPLQNISLIRQIRGDEVCSRFLQNNVTLKLRYSTTYFPVSNEINLDDIGHTSTIGQSSSCLLKCERDPITAKGDLDAFIPDGTPCQNNHRPWYDLNRFNIQLKCVRGLCTEFTDCPLKSESKDHCGICGGDGSRCVDLEFNSTYNVERLERIFLADIPAGSISIDVYASRKDNHGLVLELWSLDGHNIIGDGGEYSRFDTFSNSNAVPFAGTRWSYDPEETYLRARGPTNVTVTMKAIRLGHPLKKITIQYVRGDSS